MIRNTSLIGWVLILIYKFIDTLFLSPLFYPEQPYHRLVNDDKLDATKARDYFGNDRYISFR